MVVVCTGMLVMGVIRSGGVDSTRNSSWILEGIPAGFADGLYTNRTRK